MLYLTVTGVFCLRPDCTRRLCETALNGLEYFYVYFYIISAYPSFNCISHMSNAVFGLSIFYSSSLALPALLYMFR